MVKRKFGGTSYDGKLQKRRVKRGARRRPKGYSNRVPRVYNFMRVCSTNAATTNAISLTTNGAGYLEFKTGLVSGGRMSMEFTLAGVNWYLNGTYAGQAALPSATEFTALFDTYMIDKIDVMAMTTFSNVGMVSSPSTQAIALPYVAYVKDYDDSNDTQLPVIQQYNGVRYTNFTNGVRGGPVKLATIRPKQSVMIYNTSTTTAYGEKRGWVDCVNANVPHYGMKYALDNSSISYPVNTTVATVNFIFRYHLKLKNTI